MYSASIRRTIGCAIQLMTRAPSRPPIRYSAIGTPLARIQSPMLPSQKSCQRSAKLIASTVLFVIFPIAPTNSRFEESVDVSVEYRGRVANLVLGAQVLNHLVGVQYV